MFNPKKLPAGTGYVIFCHSPYLPDSMNHQKTFSFEIIFHETFFVTTLMCKVFYWLDKTMKIHMSPRTYIILYNTIYVYYIIMYCTGM